MFLMFSICVRSTVTSSKKQLLNYNNGWRSYLGEYMLNMGNTFLLDIDTYKWNELSRR